jgi:uncharacterized coiled-coil protein SlyX
MSHRLASEPGDAREVALSAALELHQRRPEGDTAAVIRTASTIFGWLTGSAEHDPVIIGLTKRIASLEEHMAQVDDVIVAINEATNALAARIDRVIEGTDAATAEKLRPIVTALEGMAQDKDNLVPLV